MSKKRVNVNDVNVVNHDQLAVLSDAELGSRAQELYSMLIDKSNRYACEVELAYVQRELQIRNARNIAHENYLVGHQVEADDMLDVEADVNVEV